MKWYSLILPIMVTVFLWQCSPEEVTSERSYVIHSDTVLTTPNTEDQYVSKVVLKNISDSAIIQPYIRWQGFQDLRSNDKIVQAVVDTGWSDKRQAKALFNFIPEVVKQRAPNLEKTDAMHNPAKLINSYGEGWCSQYAAAFVNLCENLSIKGRIWGLSGHVVGEVYYDSSWHMYDPYYQVFFRNSKGKIASVNKLESYPAMIDTQMKGDQDHVNWYRQLFETKEDNSINTYFEEYDNPRYRLKYSMHPQDKILYKLTHYEGWDKNESSEEDDPKFLGEGFYIRHISHRFDTSTLKVSIDWPYRIKFAKVRLFLTNGENANQYSILCKVGDDWKKERSSWTFINGCLEIPLKMFDYNKREISNLKLKVLNKSDLILKRGIDSIQVMSKFQFNPRTFLPVDSSENLAVDILPLSNRKRTQHTSMRQRQSPKLKMNMKWKRVMN